MEWQNHNHLHLQQHHNQQEQLQLQMQIEQLQNTDGVGGLYVKVMTDEQMELLRRQISVYATICEQLVEMHKAITAHQDLTGMRLGSLYCDPMMAAAGHKIGTRQRWTPTPVQLQTLEQIFEEGNGTPTKQKIKEITMQLTQHGQISEANVYNWFQNRRARSKRKQSVSAPNNGDSEADTEVESPKEKKTKPETIQFHENSAPTVPDNYVYSQRSEVDAQSNKGDHMIQSYRSNNFGHTSVISNQRIDLSIDKLEASGNYGPYHPSEDFDVMT